MRDVRDAAEEEEEERRKERRKERRGKGNGSERNEMMKLKRRRPDTLCSTALNSQYSQSWAQINDGVHLEGAGDTDIPSIIAHILVGIIGKGKCTHCVLLASLSPVFRRNGFCV